MRLDTRWRSSPSQDRRAPGPRARWPQAASAAFLATPGPLHSCSQAHSGVGAGAGWALGSALSVPRPRRRPSARALLGPVPPRMAEPMGRLGPGSPVLEADQGKPGCDHRAVDCKLAAPGTAPGARHPVHPPVSPGADAPHPPAADGEPESRDTTGDDCGCRTQALDPRQVGLGLSPLPAALPSPSRRTFRTPGPHTCMTSDWINL